MHIGLIFLRVQKKMFIQSISILMSKEKTFSLGKGRKLRWTETLVLKLFFIEVVEQVKSLTSAVDDDDTVLS